MRKIRGDPSWYPMALAIGVPMRLRCTHWVKPSLAWTVQLFPCGYASFFLKDFFERKSGPACPPHWPIPGPFPVNGFATPPPWAGAVADQCGPRLHDGHRIALALVAQGDVGQEEVAHQALATGVVDGGMGLVKRHRRPGDEVENGG